MNSGIDARPPVVAGQFYPADPDLLRDEITNYLAGVELDRGGRDIVALVAPHAGYIYSGPVAAFAYRQLAGATYDTVVVIAPSHRLSFGYSSVFGGSGYETPLGVVPVDRKTAELLERYGNGLVRVGDEGHLHGAEHSLEVQLPFLQVVLGRFKLVPVVMGAQEREIADALARALSEALYDKRALIIASTDLSHYHDQEQAERLDKCVVSSIDRFDPEGLLNDIRSRRAEACGAGPAYAAMCAARMLGATKGKDLSYMTSAARSGDFKHVVGYTAGIFYR